MPRNQTIPRIKLPTVYPFINMRTSESTRNMAGEWTKVRRPLAFAFREKQCFNLGDLRTLEPLEA